MLDRDEDMSTTGTRHSFFCKYKVGFKNDGKVVAMKLAMYNNGGNSLDLSCSVMERAIFSADNAYNIPNVDITGYPCRTNIPSNTAFRGFGGPQGMMFCENIFDHIADKLAMDPIKVMKSNHTAFQKRSKIAFTNSQFLLCTHSAQRNQHVQRRG
jgi:xanthine dehydrogenase/oxidase